MNLNLTLALALLLCACGGGGGDTAITPSGPDPALKTFEFRNDPIESFIKVDRMGGPATTTALLMPGAAGGNRRQQANLTEPVDDGQYAGEYVRTLRTLHFELAPVLQGLQLATCGIAGATVDETDVGRCVSQAAPRVIPDVLQLDTSQPSGYPNGRDADDQVIDILLAIALLDLTDPAARCFGTPCALNTLAGLPLNPGFSTPRPLTQFPFFNNVALAPPPPASP